MKKLLLGLGTLSLAALPVMAVVSCGTINDGTTLKTKPEFDKIVDSETLEIIDLKITAKPVDQSVVNAAIQSIIDTPTEDNKITALSTVFDGITVDNFNNFDGAWRGPNDNQFFDLTAKPGFSFGTSKSLTSIVITDSNLNITNKLDITEAIIESAITVINTTWSTDTRKVTALQTVFNGVTIDNFKNFDVQTTPGTSKTPGTIVLTAKPGFSFETSKTLTSIISLRITSKPVTQTIINEAIETIINTPTEADKIAALSTVFVGITTENFKNFDVTATAGTPGTIVLTAKLGFSFSGWQTLNSYPVVKMPISRKWKLDQIVINVATGIINNPNGTSEFTLFALQHLFDGITADNMQNFEIQAIEPVETTPTETIPGKVILTARSGLVFSRGEPILTTDFVAPDNWMKISPRPNLQSEITKVANLWWDYRFEVKPYDRTELLTALQTIFYGITEENFDNFTLEKPQGSHPNEVIVLTAKAPYLFSDGSSIITSKVGTPDTWLPITAKPVSQATIEKFVRIFFDLTTTPDDWFEAIHEVFDGVTKENFNHFTIFITETYPKGVITLTAKAPYSFNGQPTLNSKAV